MSETTTPKAAPRVAVRFTATGEDDGDGPVVLPGYLNPVPAQVRSGDTFTADGAYRDELNVGRFKVLGDADAQPAPASPNAALTKAELGDKLGLDDATVKSADKETLVELADSQDRTNPQPPEDTRGEIEPAGFLEDDEDPVADDTDGDTNDNDPEVTA